MNKRLEREIPQKKIDTVKGLVDLMKGKRTFLIASIKNLPASQFQEICKKLRGKAVVKVPKKNLTFRAIEDADLKEGDKLKEKVVEDTALLFSDIDAFDLSADLLENKSPAKAKAGQEAPEDIEVEAGPTDLVPGPAISELGALGIQIQIDKGKIAIKAPKVIVKKGEKISQGAASLMNKLDIKPFSIGFIPLSAYDTKENKLYTEISIDKEGTLNSLKDAFGRALAFAVGRGYSSKDTIGHILTKASAHANKLNRIWTGEPEPVTSEAPAEEKKEEAPKEEEKKPEESAAGLASLFG